MADANTNITNSSAKGGTPSSQVIENVPTIDMSGTDVERATNVEKRVTKGEVKIKLTRDHTHEGMAYSKGDEITVDETSAKFIEEVKSGTKV